VVIQQPLNQGDERGVGQFSTVDPLDPEPEPGPEVIFERSTVVDVDSGRP